MWFMVVHGTGHTLLVTYAYAMEVVQWSKLSFLQLPKGIRRILLMGTPALAVLALVGLAGWKWLRRPGQESEETRGTRVAALKPGVSVVSGEGGGNKSAAAAATSCSAETQLQPEWKNLRFEGHRGNLTVHPLAVAGKLFDVLSPVLNRRPPEQDCKLTYGISLPFCPICILSLCV